MTKKPFPETSPSPWPITRVGVKCWVWGQFFGLAICWSYALFDRRPVSSSLALGITAVTLAFGVMCFYYMWRWIAGLDELQREMQLKAFAAVFPGFLLIVTACDQLRVAKVISDITWNIQNVGFAMLAVYGVAWGWAWWRNR